MTYSKGQLGRRNGALPDIFGLFVFMQCSTIFCVMFSSKCSIIYVRFLNMVLLILSVLCKSLFFQCDNYLYFNSFFLQSRATVLVCLFSFNAAVERHIFDSELLLARRGLFSMWNYFFTTTRRSPTIAGCIPERRAAALPLD